MSIMSIINVTSAIGDFSAEKSLFFPGEHAEPERLRFWRRRLFVDDLGLGGGALFSLCCIIAANAAKGIHASNFLLDIQHTADV